MPKKDPIFGALEYAQAFLCLTLRHLLFADFFFSPVLFTQTDKQSERSYLCQDMRNKKKPTKNQEKGNFAPTRVLCYDITERARLEKLEAEPHRSDDILKKETTVAPTEADIHAVHVRGVMDTVSF